MKRKPKTGETTEYESLSQTQLIVRRFRRHKLAMFGLTVLIIFYTVAILAEFVAPMEPRERTGHQHAPPQRVRFVDLEGEFSFRPFVYGYQSVLDTDTFQRVYEPNPEQKWDIRFFTRRHEYRLLGLIPTDIHLFAVVEPEAYLVLLGTDDLGRDLFSRIIYASRISLSIGLIGVFLSLVFGLALGSLSGLTGGLIDDLIQRFIELIMSIPTLPLWMALSAAIPTWWGQTERYVAITIILSFMGWTGVARVVRGKFISLREEEFVLAAYASGVTKPRVVVRHLIPAFMSYVIVHLTLAIPGMILGETALSFLGLGLRRPAISWGVLLQQSQSISAVVNYPWLLTPGLVVVVAVLCFNFVGDGLRDAADPYSK
ncbi:MAG: ABC transporter permease [Spirochaetaceae bacterium]